MRTYNAPYYTDSQLEALEKDEISFPYSDKNATYIGLDHQYELTSAYFEERGVNLENELEGNDPNRVSNFLKQLRLKVYTRIYTHNKSSRMQLNFLIAKRGLRTWDMFEYRQSFLEMMFTEGEYLLHNGDISGVSGVDLDTMQNMSKDVIREQDRDWHKDAIGMLKTLGLEYYGRYTFVPQGEDW